MTSSRGKGTRGISSKKGIGVELGVRVGLRVGE